MALKQFTSCVPANKHVKMNQYIQLAIQAIIAAGLGVLFVAAAGEPWCLLIVAEITVIVGILGYCHWWLEDRLICLGGDHTAVGMVVSKEPPSEKSGLDKFDTDFSVNLLLPPNLPGVDQATAAAKAPFGFLIKENDATSNEGLPFTADVAEDMQTHVKSACLHAEFEGGGVADLLLGTQIALGLSVFALIVCLADTIVGAIIAAILAFLAFLAALIGGAVGINDTASPSDAGLPSIETNDSNGQGADILGVAGRWVYDAGHNDQNKGWNEIHPVNMAAKVGGPWNGDWPPDIGDLITHWTDKVGETSSPLTVAGQGRPENQWEVHPLIDGCTPSSDGTGTVIR